MRRFAALYTALDGSGGSNARVEALVAYFSEVGAADAAWALHVLLGKQGKRLITGRRLRQICLEGSPLPEWLFDDCYAHVGDSAETIALLWRQLAPESPDVPAESDPASAPLRSWMEQLLPAAAALEGDAQADAVRPPPAGSGRCRARGRHCETTPGPRRCGVGRRSRPESG